MSLNQSKFLVLLLLLLCGLLILSGLNPYDRLTWFMEIFPILIAVPIMIFTYKHYPLTILLYCLIFVHALILIVGGSYTYARVPLGFQIAELLDIQRNPYDKVGHFFQGFVPLLVAREILLRGAYIHGDKMRNFVLICIVLALSTSYEFIEWGSALALGQGADEFLGTQGDPWDTQSDMFCALIGAISSLSLLSGIHDRQLKALVGKNDNQA